MYFLAHAEAGLSRRREPSKKRELHRFGRRISRGGGRASHLASGAAESSSFACVVLHHELELDHLSNIIDWSSSRGSASPLLVSAASLLSNSKSKASSQSGSGIWPCRSDR